MRVCMQIKTKETDSLLRRWFRLRTHINMNMMRQGGNCACTLAVRPPPHQEPTPRDPTWAPIGNRWVCTGSDCDWRPRYQNGATFIKRSQEAHSHSLSSSFIPTGRQKNSTHGGRYMMKLAYWRTRNTFDLSRMTILLLWSWKELDLKGKDILARAKPKTKVSWLAKR